MKKLIYLSGFLLLAFTLVTCDEDQWLMETPEDFYTTGNAYQQPEDFDLAVTTLYSQVRNNFYQSWPPEQSAWYWYATDMAWDAIATTHGFNLYEKVIPESDIAEYYWVQNYDLIKNANAIIERIDNENIEFNPESERDRLKAEARFFRAWAYRFLGILYGDVPIVLQEFTEPKRDFVRAPVEAVWDQAIADLEFAVENLPAVTEREADGKLTKAAANHLLSELYIITEEYDKAINTATAVIDDPNYSLMTERFGSRADEPGDVYWDLFRRDNQNRSSGNTESIWVSQYEYQTLGSGRGNQLMWVLIPRYTGLKDASGTDVFLGPSEQNGGNGQGWMSSSAYMDTLIWQQSGWENDMRNSEYNIRRDLVADNPESDLYDQKIIENGVLDHNANDLRREWHAMFMKITPVGNFPPEAIADPETGETYTNAAFTYRDTYIYRLAETYLLRAEAHLKAGNNVAAAEDINAIRNRANAEPVTPGEVDVDYILDERARELAWEGTFRQLTLRRMDKLVERVREYNPVSGSSIMDYHALMPVPQSEIERNTEAELMQNPGY